MNLADLLWSSAERHATAAAVTDVRTGRSLTYAETARAAREVAAFLRAEGVEPGHRIALVGPNEPAYVPAAFGLLATGACLVPLAANLAPAERARILAAIQVNGCLSLSDAGHLTSTDARAVISSGACTGLTFAWIDRTAEAPAGFHDLNPAFVRFTSGTTAESKGVVISHEATAARVDAADGVLHLGADDRILWVLPLAYHFAVTIVAYVGAGAEILMCPDTVPGALVAAVRRFRPTVLYASPLHFQRMSNLPSTGRLEGVRWALSTSAPITAAVMHRFESRYGVPLGQAYGIIEAGLPCINLRSHGEPPASVGLPVPGYEVAVVSRTGQRLPRGASGEIAVRGAGLFSAYYSPWRARGQILCDGWFHTGDIGRFDASGALYLEGRTNAIIFVAGLKFFPEEVEECINQIPAVSESRVFARPHPHLGEIPCAEVVLAPAASDGDAVERALDAVKAHCARHLSPYKVPLELIAVPTLPKAPGGKILRRAWSA